MKRSATMTGAASVFALVVVLILANPPNAHALLFGGGMRDGLFGLAMVALAPLISVVQIGLGTALAHRFASVAALREPWLLWLCGSGLLSLIGVAIAAAGFVNPWVCGSMLILGVACAVASGACTDVLNRLIAWTRLEDVASSKPAFAVVRLGIVAALVLIGLRAATGELNDTDVVQFYWGWLNEVRHLGGIHLSPALPMVQDFTAGRGNGAYLLLAGIAPGLVSHVVSAAYCAMFAVVLRAFVLRIAADASSPLRPPLLLAAEVVCLASLWMIPGSVAFGKYHLQFAAWALGFLLACLQIASEDVRAART
ncbi:putative membrane-anchored protein [Bradyrhizobium sp. USDA 241]